MKPRYLNVQDHEGLVRDTASGGIINTDEKARSAARLKLQQSMSAKLRDEQAKHHLNTLDKKVEKMENTLNQILGLLQNITGKQDGNT